MNVVQILNLGRMKYLEALKVQNSMAERIKQSRLIKKSPQDSVINKLILVEHFPVYTTGLRTNVYSIEEEDKLKLLGAEFVRTNRGGLITFHGPGQLVCYPILDLKNFVPPSHSRKALLGMKWYIDKLEQVVIDLCKSLNLEAERSPHTGVWIGNNKVCAMGVHNSDLVTTHGLALNCNVELDWFSHIVACGIPDKGVTSLSKELNENITTADVTDLLLKQFQSHFHCRVEEPS